MHNLNYIKKQIDQAEIRICRDNALRDINHPYYTIYYKDKELAILGTGPQVKNAELLIKKVLE